MTIKNIPSLLERVQETANEYLQLGFSPIPVPAKTKGPQTKNFFDYQKASYPAYLALWVWLKKLNNLQVFVCHVTFQKGSGPWKR